MLRYYWELVKKLPSIFREMVEGWGFWLGMFMALLGLLSPELAGLAQTNLGSRWLALIPVGVLFVWGVLRVNYQRFQNLEIEKQALHSKLELTASTHRQTVAAVTRDPDKFSLIIRNESATAKFTAQVRILETRNFEPVRPQEVLHGFWFTSRGPSIEIPQGLEERLAIGMRDAATIHGTSCKALALLYFEPVKRESEKLRVNKLVQRYAPHLFPGRPEPELRLQVTVSAEPPLLAGPLILDYWLTLDGLKEPQERNPR